MRRWRRQIMLDAVPCALIARLFLAPHHFGGIRIRGDLRGKVVVRERIKLFEADDRHIADLFGAPRREQLVIHLAAARDDAAHFFVIQLIDFGDHRLEAAPASIRQAAKPHPCCATGSSA